MRPIVIASGNGLAACETAAAALARGEEVLNAVIAGVTRIEDDPSDHSVGYGGLPNEEGVVELDASVMHGPTHRAGAVAALRNVRHAARVAHRVMEKTAHLLLVGEGALAFARAEGFPEENLLTDAARRYWEAWRHDRQARQNWSYPTADRATEPGFTHGTVTVLAVDERGDLAGCTSTSGLSYKRPGRVGDSPIIGAGLYVDNHVGAAGSTGHGELNLRNCSSFQVVELMRQGFPPAEACVAVLQRVVARLEPALCNPRGEPAVELNLFALRKDGEFGGARLRAAGFVAAAVRGRAWRTPVTPLYQP